MSGQISKYRRETGFLVDPNNEIELAKALQKLIEDNTLRNEFGKNGFKRANKFFTLEKYVSSFETSFEEK